jgi:hypothetical protein
MALLTKEQCVNNDAEDYENQNRPFDDLYPLFFSLRSISRFTQKRPPVPLLTDR